MVHLPRAVARAPGALCALRPLLPSPTAALLLPLFTPPHRVAGRFASLPWARGLTPRHAWRMRPRETPRHRLRSPTLTLTLTLTHACRCCASPSARLPHKRRASRLPLGSPARRCCASPSARSPRHTSSACCRTTRARREARAPTLARSSRCGARRLRAHGLAWAGGEASRVHGGADAGAAAWSRTVDWLRLKRAGWQSAPFPWESHAGGEVRRGSARGRPHSISVPLLGARPLAGGGGDQQVRKGDGGHLWRRRRPRGAPRS